MNQMSTDEFERKEKEEMKRLGISEETMKSMKAFFAKTSAPRLIRKKRKQVAEEWGKEKTEREGGIKMIGLVFGLVLGFIVYETFAIIKKDNAN